VAEKCQGVNLVIGPVEEKNHKQVGAQALAYKHSLGANSPIDVNLAKQLNILISDMRLPLERILMDPTTGALGYGLEYTYSVMERLKLAALTGDGMTQQPMIVTVGYEAWRAKETRVNEGIPAEWGDWEKRSYLWETVTATALLESGADMLVMRHPDAIARVKGVVAKLMADA